METTYWTETFGAALPYINSHAKPGDVIWSSQWSNTVLNYYQMLGMLRKDVQVFDGRSGKFPLNAAWYVYESRQSQYGFNSEAGYAPLKMLSTQTPVLEIDYQGIPLMKLYQALK